MAKTKRPAQPKPTSKLTRQGAYTSRYKGVGYHVKYHRWQAVIRVDGKLTWLGYFDTEQEAADAYDEAAEEAYGNEAILNRDLRLMYEAMKKITG